MREIDLALYLLISDALDRYRKTETPDSDYYEIIYETGQAIKRLIQHSTLEELTQ